jgi:CRP/FNR family cyclic AMP-dependent transcriptional regulator
MNSLESLLAQSSWSQSLDPGQAAQLRSEIVERSVPADGFVCQKGEPVEAWIGVISGLVKISSVSFEGKAVTFAGVPSGGWFGEGSLLKPEPRRYDAIALRDSRIAYMPRRTFQRLLDTSIEFNRFLLLQINERLGQFIGALEHERLLGPEARVARCLAQLFNRLLYPRADNRLEISQREVGFLTGLSRQRVNQALQSLQERNLLRVEYGRIVVLALDELETLE